MTTSYQAHLIWPKVQRRRSHIQTNESFVDMEPFVIIGISRNRMCLLLTLHSAYESIAKHPSIACGRKSGYLPPDCDFRPRSPPLFFCPLSHREIANY